MIRHIAHRLLWLFVVAVGMTLLTFVLTHLIPADPAKYAAGLDATADQIERVKRDLGLDRPLHEQYLIYLRNLASGDLGMSIITKRPVRDDLTDYFPATLELALSSIVVTVLIGVPLGVISAVRHGGLTDLLTRLFATFWVAVPVFWFGLLLQLIFYVRLGWLPIGGRIDPAFTVERVTGLLTLDAVLQGQPAAVCTALHHLLLTTLGTQIGFLLGGAILVEAIFQWPGMGRYAVSSITSVDFPAIMGVALLSGIIFVLVNLLVDLAYLALDPRISY